MGRSARLSLSNKNVCTRGKVYVVQNHKSDLGALEVYLDAEHSSQVPLPIPWSALKQQPPPPPPPPPASLLNSLSFRTPKHPHISHTTLHVAHLVRVRVCVCVCVCVCYGEVAASISNMANWCMVLCIYIYICKCTNVHIKMV